MSKFTVQMMGIMYFNVCAKDAEDCSSHAKEVLIPDGRQGDGHIPPHVASLFIDKDLCIRDDWWTDERVEHQVHALEQGQVVTKRVIEFRIPPGSKPATIKFPDQGTGMVQVVNLDRLLPMIGKVDPQFVLDLENPSAIARVPISGGRLEAFAFNEGAAAVQWTFEVSGPQTITATTETGLGSVTVKAAGGRLGTEIVLSNTPELLSRVQLPGGADAAGAPDHPTGHLAPAHAGPHPAQPHPNNAGAADHHFQLYGKLEKHKDGSRLMFPKTREDLPFGAHYLRAISNVHLAGACTPTCCA